jgi:hypothetical protein
MWLEGDMSTHAQGGALRWGGFLRSCKTENIVTSDLQCHKFLAYTYDLATTPAGTGAGGCLTVKKGA